MKLTNIDRKTGAAPASVPSRRAFLGQTAALIASGIAFTTAGPETAHAQDHESGSARQRDGQKREKQAYQIRVQAAQRERDRGVPDHTTNGDEQLYPNKIASFSKGLPHNGLGEVDLAAFATLIQAVTSGDPADFENIATATRTDTGKLTDPQAGLAFEMVGADSHALFQKAAPAFSSAEEAAEIAENYWMALTRDVPFGEYDENPLTISAVGDLSRFSGFTGPKAGQAVTTGTLFRGLTAGDLVGPYISQFMLLDTTFGAERVDRRIHTTLPNVDYMTGYDDWLAVQKGSVAGQDQYDPTHRYIRSGRDLAAWVHVDVLYQAYFNAMLILLGLGAPFDANNPYNTSQTQKGFGTFGPPYIASVLCQIAKPALKAVWYQKWFVHRRLRPEAFAGRVHNHVTKTANYPINAEIFNAQALTEVFSRYGTYLLPMAFPEGSPTHPSYGAGHATVAGACVTILKAFFDESHVIPNPVQASPDGLLIRINNQSNYVFAYVPGPADKWTFDPLTDVYIKSPAEKTFHR